MNDNRNYVSNYQFMYIGYFFQKLVICYFCSCLLPVEFKESPHFALSYNGRMTSKSWGNIPIVLIIGDDYQLPPVESGVFQI